MSASSIAQATHDEAGVQRLSEIFTVCVEDVRHQSVVQLANHLLLIFCVWQNSDQVLGGIIEKVLVKRVGDPSCPFQLRESAISALTIFHVLDILRTPKSFLEREDMEGMPRNRVVASSKYLESFFRILSDLVKNVVVNISKEMSRETARDISENQSMDGMEDVGSESDDQTSEESSESLAEDQAELKKDFYERVEIDPKDSLLIGIINAWVCIVPLVSEEKFDEEFAGFYEMFEKLIQHHKNPDVKVVACEAMITLNDLNERLPMDKQYDIEIQPLLDRLYGYAKRIVTNKHEKNKQEKNKRQIWLNLARALEADKCVVELPFLTVQTKFLITPTKNQVDKRKLYQKRSRKETFWTNWSEAMTVKYIKNILGHQFNGLMQSAVFSSKIFSMMEQKDSWHLAHQNSPLSMVYVQAKRGVLPAKVSFSSKKGNLEDQWTYKWWKKSNHGQKESVKSYVKNGLFV